MRHERIDLLVSIPQCLAAPGSPTGRPTRTLLAAVAEFEGDLIRERTQVAMDAILSGRRKTRSGRPVGRPRRVTPEVVAKIAELRAAGHKWNEVARRVGLPAETCREGRPGGPRVPRQPWKTLQRGLSHPLRKGSLAGD